MKTTSAQQIAGPEREHAALTVLNSTSFCCAFSPCCVDIGYRDTQSEIPQSAGEFGYRTIALEACCAPGCCDD
jgi:hypothetical protein